jgi:riboflavin biosynthesis pyrimidine reductase
MYLTQESQIRVLIIGGGYSLANSFIMMYNRLICYQSMKLMSRSGRICSIIINANLILIYTSCSDEY